MKKLFSYLLMGFFIFTLVSCDDNSLGNTNNQYDIVTFDIESYNIEVYEEILFGMETLAIELYDIVDIEITDIEFVESDFFIDFVNQDIINQYENTRINWNQIQKDLLIGSGLYFVSFVIRTLTQGPIVAVVAFISDVSIGLVFDFLSEVIPMLAKGEAISPAVILESLARGFKYGAMFDFASTFFGSAFGHLSKALNTSREMKRIAKTTGYSIDTVKEASDTLISNMDSIVKNVDIERTAATIKNNIEGLTNISSDSKKLLKEAFTGGNLDSFERILGNSNNQNAILLYQNYKKITSQRELVKGMSSDISIRIKQLNPNEVYDQIVNKRNTQFLTDYKISNMKALDYLHANSIVGLSPTTTMQRSSDFYFERLSKEYHGSYTYLELSRNPNYLDSIALNKQDLTNVLSVAKYDTNISSKFKDALLVYEKTLFLEGFIENRSLTRIQLAQIIKEVELTKNPELLLDLMPSSMSKKVALDQVSTLISSGQYKAQRLKITVEYLMNKFNITDRQASQIAKAQTIRELDNAIKLQSLDSIVMNELLSAFGLATKTDLQFKELIINQYGEEIANIFVKFKNDPVKLTEALRALETDPLFFDKGILEVAQMNKDQILGYISPSLDGNLKALLSNTSLMKYLDETSAILDHTAVIARLKTKYRPSDVDLFEKYLNSSSDVIRKQFMDSVNAKKIAQDYFFNIDLTQLSELQRNQILFARILQVSQESSIYKNGLLTINRIDELVYYLKSGSPEDFFNLVQNNNIFRELYEQTLIRRPDVLFELHKKGLINLSPEVRLDILNKRFNRLIQISESNVDEAIIESARYIQNNGLLLKLSDGLIDQIDEQGMHNIILHYNMIKTFMQVGDPAVYNRFIDKIATVRAKMAIDEAMKLYTQIQDTLQRSDLSFDLIERLNVNKALIESYLTKTSRYSQVTNKQFEELYTSLGLTYDEAIQRFYTEVTYVFQGVEYTKKFAKFDLYSETLVTMDGLVGQGTDFSRGNQYLGVSFNPNYTTQHHAEDGYNLLYINTEVHKAIIHDGGASLLRVKEELRQITTLLAGPKMKVLSEVNLDIITNPLFILVELMTLHN